MKALSNCKRCGIEFEDNNEAVECPECDCLTLCEMCARDNSCCVSENQVDNKGHKNENR